MRRSSVDFLKGARDDGIGHCLLSERSLSFHMSSSGPLRVDIGEHAAWPVGVQVFHSITFTIVRALCEGRQCVIRMERRLCICVCLKIHLACMSALRFPSKFICDESLSVRDQC